MRVPGVAIVIVMATTVACGSPPAPGPAPAPAPSPPSARPVIATVFDYTGTDGEFGYSITLMSDGSWTQQEHSGSAPPSGTLGPQAMQRFLAALDAAPFRTTVTPCDQPAPGQASYRDGRRNRTAHASSREDPGRGWVPCGDTVDELTEGLAGCLALLISGSDAGC